MEGRSSGGLLDADKPFLGGYLQPLQKQKLVAQSEVHALFV